tara:strand:- start:460 stop:2514 length:2055 start_codon:yes stop_codon:yes gene_type:complete
MLKKKSLFKNKFIDYRPEIDGIRAIAVISVIFYHAKINLFNIDFFKGGFIGVDIFFVISGYLITSIIIKEIIKTGSFSLKYFYERRIRRILPPLLFVIICSAPLAWFYLLPEDFILYSKSILYSLGFLSNYFFLNIGAQYGAPDTLYLPMLHTWSLAVEEQFYIIFPLFLILVFKISKKKILTIFLVMFLLSLFLAAYLSRNYSFVSFYILPTRIFELVAGSLLAYMRIKKLHLNKLFFLNSFMPFIGLVLILFSIFYFDNSFFHPSFITLIPLSGVCLIILYSNKNEYVHKILSTKLFVSLGLISYSLYLWHYPIFAFARKTEYILGDPNKKLAVAIIILILSILSYFLIERPSRNQRFNYKIIFSTIFILSSLTIFFNYSVIKNDGFKSRVPDNLKVNITDAPWTLLRSQNNKDCHNWDRGCVFYSYPSKKTVNLIGDSQMGALSYDLKDRLINNGYTFQSFTMGACGFYPGFDLVNTKTKKTSLNCNNKYFSKIMNTLSKQKNSIIIFGGKFQLHLENTYYVLNENQNLRELKDSEQKFISNGNYKDIKLSFSNTIKDLSKNNKIILIYPIPEANISILNTINNLLKDNNQLKDILSLTSTSYSEYKNRTKSVFEFLNSINGNNIYRVYPHELLCGTKIVDLCVSHNDKDIYYHDEIHPSLKGSEIINELIMNKITKVDSN